MYNQDNFMSFMYLLFNTVITWIWRRTQYSWACHENGKSSYRPPVYLARRFYESCRHNAIVIFTIAISSAEPKSYPPRYYKLLKLT
jgi:hypothetical protein